MSLKLNLLSVPAEFQEDVEKIAVDRFPDSVGGKAGQGEAGGL